ncbi:MAG: hypothetical protein AB7F78_00060 [Hyphomicrobiaceae bacterium]
MGRKASQQATFSKGELDPDLSERTDLEHVYDSLAVALNCVFHPQGGVSDRGGFSLISDADVLAAGTSRRLRRRIVPLDLDSDMITAANGGTAASLVDQSPATLFTTNAVTASPFVVAEIDLGASQYVDLVDVLDFQSELGPADGCLAIEFWNGSAWAAFADPLDAQPRKHIRTTARRRRFGTAPGGPGGIRVAARQWRIVLYAATGTGTFSIGGLRMWAETSRLGSIDVREVAREQGATYELVLTERNIDVFEQQRYVASIAVPLTGQQVLDVTQAGGFDTLLLFHEMLEPQRIVRQGSGGEWNCAPLAIEDVPDLKPQIVFAGTQDEIQDVSVPGITVGAVLTVCLGDLIGAPFVYSTAGALPGQIAAALGDLPGVVSGDFLATLADATPTARIRFTGDNGGRAWPLISVLTASAIDPVTTVVQQGLLATGELMGEETGWPRCGAFVQERLLLAGMRAAPTTFAFSRPASFNFLDTTDPMTADLALVRTLDVDSVETIYTAFVGRHLQLFTETGEWYIAANTIDATQPQGATRVSSNGIRRAVPIAFADGGSLFVQQGGQTLRDMLWSDAEQSYRADPITVLSPQIMKSVIDVAHRSARSVSEGNLIFMTNADGTAACLTLLRGQNVVAGAPWRYAADGKLISVLADVRHDAYAIVELAGERWLVKWQKAMPLDHATTRALGGASQVTGAYDLAGRVDVWAYCDGELLGPLAVSNSGTIDLGRATQSVTYGLVPPWTARLQVLRDKLARDVPFKPPARIYEVELALKDTGALTIATNGGAHRPVPLQTMGGIYADAGPLATETGGASALPMLDRLYTGNRTVSGLLGFSRTPYVELSRDVPVPVHVKSVRMEVVMRD